MADIALRSRHRRTTGLGVRAARPAAGARRRDLVPTEGRGCRWKIGAEIKRSKVLVARAFFGRSALPVRHTPRLANPRPWWKGRCDARTSSQRRLAAAEARPRWQEISNRGRIN